MEGRAARAVDALDLVEQARRPNGGFAGRSWTSRAQPGAVQWGRPPDNLLLNEIATSMLAAAGLPVSPAEREVLLADYIAFRPSFEALYKVPGAADEQSALVFEAAPKLTPWRG